MAVDAWLIFVGVWIVAGIPLGPNAMNCISLSATAGFRYSLWSIAGILLAALCHITASVLGIATFLLANAELFQVLKYFGAAYLAWLGISFWRKKQQDMVLLKSSPASPVKIVRQSFLISMTNPKAVISYLAVFSQFISPAEPLYGQLLVLLPTSLVITGMIYLAYCGVGRALTRILSTLRRQLIFNKIIGAFYMVAGAGLAFADVKPSASEALTR